MELVSIINVWQICAGQGAANLAFELSGTLVPLPAMRHMLNSGCCMLAQVDDLVVALDPGLQPAAAGVAQQLRNHGRVVDLTLEHKKMKWIFKVSMSLAICPRAQDATFIWVSSCAQMAR